MIQINKEKIKQILMYTWPYYLISCLVFSIGFPYVFSLIHKPTNVEKLSIFVSGETEDLNLFKRDYCEKYNLRQIEIISSTLENPYYLEKLTVAGYHTCDILLIPENILHDLILDQFALNLNEEIINLYFENCNFYEQENINYGTKLNKDYLKDYFVFNDEDYFILINASSENIGIYFDAKNELNINSFLLAKEWSLYV